MAACSAASLTHRHVWSPGSSGLALSSSFTAFVKLLVLSADFDLDALRSRLDEDGMAIAERQEESSKQRRALADGTKGTCEPCILFTGLH